MISFQYGQLPIGSAIESSGERSTSLGSGASLVWNFAGSTTTVWSVALPPSVTVIISKNSSIGLNLHYEQIIYLYCVQERKGATWLSSVNNESLETLPRSDARDLTEPERHPNLTAERSELLTQIYGAKRPHPPVS